MEGYRGDVLANHVVEHVNRINHLVVELLIIIEPIYREVGAIIISITNDQFASISTGRKRNQRDERCRQEFKTFLHKSF